MSSPNTCVEAPASNVMVLRGAVFDGQFGLDNPMMIFDFFFLIHVCFWLYWVFIAACRLFSSFSK